MKRGILLLLFAITVPTPADAQLTFRAYSSSWKQGYYSFAEVDEDGVTKDDVLEQDAVPTSGAGTSQGSLVSTGDFTNSALWVNADGIHTATVGECESWIYNCTTANRTSGELWLGGRHTVSHNIQGTAPPNILTTAESRTGGFLSQSFEINDVNYSDGDYYVYLVIHLTSDGPSGSGKKPLTGYKMRFEAASGYTAVSRIFQGTDSSTEKVYVEAEYDPSLYSNAGGWHVRSLRIVWDILYGYQFNTINTTYQNLGDYTLATYIRRTDDAPFTLRLITNDFSAAEDDGQNTQGLSLLGVQNGLTGAGPTGTWAFNPVIVAEISEVDEG